MEQMRLYGIPASVTLAQGILESANGESRLARNENNHFGIKATKSWIAAGGRYGLYTDDKPNEKFCSYDSVADSYEHHSKFLKENSRYSACFALSADDYKGWAWGLDNAGYATAGKYAPSLISVIERMDLHKYDEIVMTEMAAKGMKPGQVQASSQGHSPATAASSQSTAYSFPLKRDEFLFVTSKFGNRVDPMDRTKTQFHKGIDIRCDNEALLAPESNGKVVATNENAGTAGGKSVTIEYDRQDGTKYQVCYCHLSSVGVKVGDTVTAGQQIGVSGNTGTRTTGPHLHFSVKQVAEDGTKRDIDPAAYLAEIAQRGGIGLTAMYNGKDLLQKYKDANPLSPDEPLIAEEPAIDTELSPEDWMKKLLSSEDSGVNMGSHGDPVIEMVMTLFTSLMALAVAIDNKSEDEAMEIATDAAINRRIDLTSLTPGLRECVLSVNDGGKALLNVNDGRNAYAVELTSNDLNRLNLILQDSSLSHEEKQSRIAGMINSVVLAAGMSQNYQQSMQQGQNEQITIK